MAYRTFPLRCVAVYLDQMVFRGYLSCSLVDGAEVVTFVGGWIIKKDYQNSCSDCIATIFVASN